MKQNMGSADRLIRLIIAAIIGILYAAGIVTDTLGVVLLIIAIILALTSLVSVCGLYKLFGINTCPIDKKE